MKVSALVLLAVGYVSAGSGPYLPSGWRPDGPAFLLPTENQKPTKESIEEAPLQESEASGSDFLREYGPPKLVDVSQDITRQYLPDVITEQAFVQGRFNLDDEIKRVFGQQVTEAIIKPEEISKIATENQEAVTDSQAIISQLKEEENTEAKLITDSNENTSQSNAQEISATESSEVTQQENSEVLEVRNFIEETTSKNKATDDSTEIIVETTQTDAIHNDDIVLEANCDDNEQHDSQDSSENNHAIKVNQNESASDEVSTPNEVAVTESTENSVELIQENENTVNVVEQNDSAIEPKSISNDANAENVNKIQEINETEKIISEQEIVTENSIAIQESAEVKQQDNENIKNEEEIVENLSKAVKESDENAEDALVRLDNENTHEEQKVDAIDVIAEGRARSSEQIPESLLNFEHLGFREYGPPKQDLLFKSEIDQNGFSNELRKRRFSPRFRSTRRH